MNIGYHSARFQGAVVRRLYSELAHIIAKRRIKQDLHLPVSVYSFSCLRDLPEQIASIRSFLRFVCIPEKFVVVSDGSHTKDSAEILRSIHPVVLVADYESFVNRDLPKTVIDYARNNGMGKKLAVELSLPILSTTIFVDADVLFFPTSIALTDLITSANESSWYLPDAHPSLDERLLTNSVEIKCAVNAGFMLMKKPLDWTKALERLSQLNAESGFFTEQTMVHLAMHSSQAKPLCRNKFVLKLDDQCYYTDWYASTAIALRHYVGPVRHKMWCRLPG